MQLSDKAWHFIQGSIPRPNRNVRLGGRKRLNDRQVMEGILWVLRSGARWSDLPDCFPSRATCHRRYQEWVNVGVFDDLLVRLADTLERQDLLELHECFIDATFAPAKRGGEDREDETRKRQ